MRLKELNESNDKFLDPLKARVQKNGEISYYDTDLVKAAYVELYGEKIYKNINMVSYVQDLGDILGISVDPEAITRLNQMQSEFEMMDVIKESLH